MVKAARSQIPMPEELAAQLRAARRSRSMEGERRVVTLLFCDVSGSTAMAEQFDPEEWAEIMNEAFDYLIAPIYRYEGTVARLMGDGLLAFFGAPIAHEDDPQRAILAGLDIVKGLRAYAEEIQQVYGVDFNVRVGINTGPVVVGEIGSDLAVEYTAMGDAINLASRMETTALPGTVQIADDTYKLVSPLFDVWEVGPIQVKGKAEPIQAYRVLGWRAEPGRQRGGEGLDAPLVGREAEMQVLRRAIADLRAGRGGIVCIAGEAGLGKSRLIQELAAETLEASREMNSPLLWLESRGVSFEGTRPYGLFVQFMRQNMGIREGDSPSVVRAKISRGAAALPADQRAGMARVAQAVLGVKTDKAEPASSATGGGGSDVTALEGESLERELFATLLGVVRTVASQQPTVMVCDDIHWADSASIDLLVHLFQLVNEVPVLFLCAFREYRRSPAWHVVAMAESQYHQSYAELKLGPLAEAESERLVASLFDTADIPQVSDMPEELCRAILTKTEGNPFFVEEVVRALIDAGAVVREGEEVRWNSLAAVQDIAIPDNVQSLLIARIDRLEREARRTLQLAAVIGRTFQHRVLKTLSDTAVVALDKQLDLLQRAGLIREAARDPELTYTFRHGLTRDAAYASILHRDRRQFHRRVGEVIESLFSDRLEEEAHQLAYHFDRGRDLERALKYYTMAGDHAAFINANADAVELYGRAIEIEAAMNEGLRRRGSEFDAGRLAYLYARRGRALEIYGRYDDALENYKELEQLGRELDAPALELAALLPQATLHSTFTAKFNPQRGRALSERALELARGLKDVRAEAKALWNLMLVSLYAEDNRQQALAYGEASLALARKHNLREELAYTLHDIANAYSIVGRGQDAWAASEEAGELWRDMGNLPMLVDNLANSAWGRYQQGRLGEAIGLADEALRVSRSIESLWGQAYSFFTLAPFHLEQGAYVQAIDAIEQGIPLARQANFDIGHELSAALGGVFGFLGDLRRGVDILHESITATNRPEDRLLALTILAQISIHHRRPTQAAAAIRAAHGQFPSDAINPFLSIFRMVAPVIEAELALWQGAYGRVLSICADAIREASRPNAPTWNRHTVTADLLRLSGQALLAQGRVDDAQKALVRARAEAKVRDSDRMSWMYLYILWQRRTMWTVLGTLSAIAEQRGEDAQAHALRTEARHVIESIAGHIEDEHLNAAFRGLPDVKPLMHD
jgi:class 3 adenylate cyclase/tetratricopeptide (TPR) repeat protein